MYCGLPYAQSQVAAVLVRVMQRAAVGSELLGVSYLTGHGLLQVGRCNDSERLCQSRSVLEAL